MGWGKAKLIDAIPHNNTFGTQELTVTAIACGDSRGLGSKRNLFRSN
jgi:hypothetical protein